MLRNENITTDDDANREDDNYYDSTETTRLMTYVAGRQNGYVGMLMLAMVVCFPDMQRLEK